MATMIPDTIPGTAPNSEKIIFNNLKHSPHTRGWVVFHSVYVKNPKYKARPHEIDFLILIPEYCSIVCLEAKGGSYKIKDGMWHTVPGKRIYPSPPDQARQAMFAFKEEYAMSYFKPGSLLSPGCAVAFTDASFPRGASRPKQALIIEHPDPRDPDRLPMILANHADNMRLDRVKNELKRKGADWMEALRAMKDLELELKRPMMITTPTEKIFSSDLEMLRKQLLRLTTEQIYCLEQIQSKWNNHCVIAGAAGTGKTVLAMELARRLCNEGENVALLCSNPYLSHRFQRWTKELPNDNGGSVVAGTPATLPLEVLIADEKLRDNHQKRLNCFPQHKKSLKPGALNSKWVKFLEETTQALDQVEASFDYLIVDEAQNLCDEVFLCLMDALLKGKLKDGRWTMFGDFEYQHILNMDGKVDKDENDGRKKLQTWGLHFAAIELKINCRNTYEIAAKFAKLAAIKSTSMSGVHGPLVKIKLFKSEAELQKLLEVEIGSLKNRGFDSRQIILLADDRDDFGTAPGYADWQLKNIREAKVRETLDSKEVLPVSGDDSPNKLRYSDIYDFQGLESEVVILVMPLTENQPVLGDEATTPNENHFRRVLYTGMSRAKAMLIIVADKSYKAFLNDS